MTDTTQESRMEVSERRYRRLFESAHDGILILDAGSGQILDANPYLLTLLGYKEQELLGKQPYEIGIFADIEANKAALKELQEKHQIRYENLPLQTKNHDQQIDVEFVSNVYQEGDRSVIQCNIRDIRTRKAETDAARLEVKRGNTTRDQLLAMVAHELRTPLNAVQGWSQVLRRSLDNPGRLATGLEAILCSARVQSRLVEDLLDMSRIAYGKLLCDRQPLDIVNIVSDAIETARPMADGKRIELKWTDRSREVVVSGDAVRLHQVFDNILFNALKFTLPGGFIEVLVCPGDTEVDIRFRDTGRGISSDDLPFIFDCFRQAGPAGSQKQGGLGLGLTIVKELVILHDGTVKAESQGEGQGATFTVTLPLAGRKKDKI
jgi:PAS domain S-box-containing protein